MSYPYPEGVSECVAAQALVRRSLSFRQLEEEIGVDHATIHRWTRRYTGHTESRIPGSILGTPLDRSLSDKLRILLESQDLSEQALGAYLRQNGLCSSDLDIWREELHLINLRSSKMSRPKRTEKEKYEALRKENLELAKKLRRAEKLRREAEVLVEVQKKAQEIWAKDAEEDEKSN